MAVYTSRSYRILLRGHHFIRKIRPHTPIITVVAMRDTEGVGGRRKTNVGWVDQGRLCEALVFELSRKGGAEL